MGDSPDKSAGEGDNGGSNAMKPPAGKPAGADSETSGKLPVVWSPTLNAGEEAMEESPNSEAGETGAPPHDDASNENASEPATTTPPPRSSRFALLAATIALAAAIGSFVGSLTASGIVRPAPAPAQTLTTGTTDGRDTSKAMKLALTELSAIKEGLDSATRNTNAQFAKMVDRLDRVEHAAADPATKLAHIADTVDRLDKLNTAPETTSAITPGATPPSAPKPADKVLEGWVVQDVRGDRALVTSRYGGLFDVGAGSILPGIGRVDAVKRQDGQWIVVTARGVITSGR